MSSTCRRPWRPIFESTAGLLGLASPAAALPRLAYSACRASGFRRRTGHTTSTPRRTASSSTSNPGPPASKSSETQSSHRRARRWLDCPMSFALAGWRPSIDASRVRAPHAPMGISGAANVAHPGLPALRTNLVGRDFIHLPDSNKDPIQLSGDDPVNHWYLSPFPRAGILLDYSTEPHCARLNPAPEARTEGR